MKQRVLNYEEPGGEETRRTRPTTGPDVKGTRKGCKTQHTQFVALRPKRRATVHRRGHKH